MALTLMPGVEGGIWEATHYDESTHDEVYGFVLRGCKGKELKEKCETTLERYSAGEIGPCVYVERMAVMEMPKGGGVLIYSAIPITPDLKASVDEKGGCKVIVIPTSEHAKHHRGWMEAYPEAVVICPGGDSMAPVIADLGDAAKVIDFNTPAKWSKEAVRALNGISCEVLETAKFQEVLLMHRKSKTMLSCDSIYLGCGDKADAKGWKNFPAPEWQELYWKAYCEKSPCYLPVYRTFLSPEEQKIAGKTMKKVFGWKPERVMSARSGTTSEKGAAEAMQILEGHWKWCVSAL